ncbi:MAG: hypothetical protein VYE40_13280 [Myxococcota bacterium]|jgi:hypothetical protein|nr:hypothetical protein [Myxococcota bacterium]MEC9442070.1 hypothetical protein [Myxococcota bacterium]
MSSAKPEPISSPISAHGEHAISEHVDNLALALMRQLAPDDEWTTQTSHDWRPDDYDWATCHGMSGTHDSWGVFVQYSFGGASPRDGGGSFSVRIMCDGEYSSSAYHQNDAWHFGEGDATLFEALRRACVSSRGG